MPHNEMHIYGFDPHKYVTLNAKQLNLTSGIYIYRLEIDGEMKESKKLTILK